MKEQIRFRNEPAIWIGLIAAILLAVQEQVATGNVSAEVLIPVVLGVITRFFVTPAVGESRQPNDLPNEEPKE